MVVCMPVGVAAKSAFCDAVFLPFNLFLACL